MNTVLCKCPNCGEANEYNLLTNKENADNFEANYNPNGSANQKEVIEGFRNRNPNAYSPEVIYTRIPCVKCGEDFSMDESTNWNELKSLFDD